MEDKNELTKYAIDLALKQQDKFIERLDKINKRETSTIKTFIICVTIIISLWIIGYFYNWKENDKMSFWDWLDKILYPHGHGKHIAPKETKEGVKDGPRNKRSDKSDNK